MLPHWRPRGSDELDDELIDLTAASVTAADTSWSLDGCDQCGHSDLTGGAYLAQARFRFTLPSGHKLMLCAHHGRLAAPHMTELGARVDDLSATAT